MIRCAVVPPAPAPYREPLFAGLAARDTLALRVIYQAGRPAGWDQAQAWFPDRHAYDAVHLRAFQRQREGGTPVVWPRGLERELRSFAPTVVVAWEYGPTALRAWAWCARRSVPLVLFSENTPLIEERLPAAQLRLHRWLAGRATGFIAASSAARERFLALGAAPDAVEVSLQSFDPGPIRAAQRAPHDGPVRLLTVARLVPDKNVGGLIEAFARAGLTPHEAELHIAGSGPLEDELRALATRLHVPARFAGYTAPDGPSRHLRGRRRLRPAVAVRALRRGLARGGRRRAAGRVQPDGRRRQGHRRRGAQRAAASHPRGARRALTRVVRDGELRARLARGSRELDAEHPIANSVDAFERAISRAAMFAR